MLGTRVATRDDILLKPATADDFDLTFSIKKAAGGGYIRDVFGWDEGVQIGFHERQFVPENARLILVDGAIAGWISVFDYDHSATISELYVLPEHQGRGIGTAVLLEVIAHARGRGVPLCLRVFKINQRGRRLYERLGFRAVEEPEGPFLPMTLDPSSADKRTSTGWYEELPKIELHVHLEGAIPHEGLFDLIQKYGGDPSVPDIAALARRFQYKDFPQFIESWSWKNRFLREYDDFSHIAELVARDLARQQVRYAEVMFSPSLFVRHGLEVQELTRAVRAGLSRVAGIEIGLIADLVRDYGPESETATLARLKEVKDLGVVGIGIGGSEHEFPPGPFKPLYEEARRLKFHTNAHAGEAAGAASIWDALLLLQAERIGHGVWAHEDFRLVRYLAEHRIPLEMCPGSNVRTKVVTSLAEHPIRGYFEAGLVVTVNTDDPKMFQTTLADEYRLLVEECGFTKPEICRLVLAAVESSWLPEERKKAMAAELTSHPTWMRA